MRTLVVVGRPGISRAYDLPDTRLAGISAECVSRRLNADKPTDAQLAALAEAPRVRQYAPGILNLARFSTSIGATSDNY